MIDLRHRLLLAFARYRRHWPDEHLAVNQFDDFLVSASCAFVRTNLAGHFTASAFVVNADGARVLLTHHRKLGRWLQPGGHADGDENLANVALREAQEETGLLGLQLDSGEIFDLDRHRIPARGVEPEHWHYDVRYLVRVAADEAYVVGEESYDLAWVEISRLSQDESIDPSLRRMACKWLQRLASDSSTA